MSPEQLAAQPTILANEHRWRAKSLLLLLTKGVLQECTKRNLIVLGPMYLADYKSLIEGLKSNYIIGRK